MGLFINEVSKEDLKNITNAWRSERVDPSPLLDFDFFIEADNVKVFSVSDDKGTLLALFEIRNCRQYIKSMQLLFSIDLALKIESTDGNEFLEGIKTITRIVSKVFDNIVSSIGDTGLIKIYNNQHEIKTMFIEFAKQLTSSTDYGCKFYKNWIEISKSN